MRPGKPPPLATGDSLSRWCLRALHLSCDSMLEQARQAGPGVDPTDYARHRGPPPLRFCCIAPHCQEWRGSGGEQGYCDYGERWKKTVSADPFAPAPHAPADGRIGKRLAGSAQALGRLITNEFADAKGAAGEPLDETRGNEW